MPQLGVSKKLAEADNLQPWPAHFAVRQKIRKRAHSGKFGNTLIWEKPGGV